MGSWGTEAEGTPQPVISSPGQRKARVFGEKEKDCDREGRFPYLRKEPGTTCKGYPRIRNEGRHLL